MYLMYLPVVLLMAGTLLVALNVATHNTAGRWRNVAYMLWLIAVGVSVMAVVHDVGQLGSESTAAQRVSIVLDIAVSVLFAFGGVCLLGLFGFWRRLRITVDGWWRRRR
jgi:hypothetical protein